MKRHQIRSKIPGHEKTLKPLRFQGFLMISTRDQRLQNFLISCKTARHFPKTLLKMTEMVLRFPLGFP